MRIPRFPRTLAAVAAISTALALLVALLFQWNWLKAPVASYLSDKLGRTVAINGDLQGEFSLQPLLTANDVSISNVAWAADREFLRAKQVNVRVDLGSLFKETVSLLELTLSDALLSLERDAEGHENWDFGDKSATTIGRLAAKGGIVRFRDRSRAVDVSARVDSAASGADGSLTIRFDGKGVWQGNDFAMAGTAITPFSTEAPGQPYQLDVHAQSGPTTATFAGMLMPTKDYRVDGALTLKGQDLAQINAFLPLEVSRTPPYHLAGTLKLEQGVWSLREFKGKIGETDLAGRLDIDRQRQRTLVTADLSSQSASYRDMRALIGVAREGGPPPAKAPAAKPAAAPAKQASAERAAKARDTEAGTGDLTRLRLVDAKIKLKSKRFTVPNYRLDNLNAAIDLRNGVLTIQPLQFGLAGGQVTSTVWMDARGKTVKSTADMTLRDLALSEIVPELKPPQGSAGKASGRAHFTSTGNSIEEMLPATHGEIALMSSGGNSSSLTTGLGRIDLSRAGKLLLRGKPETPVQCAMTDMIMTKGVLDVKTLVIATETETITGHGKIDSVGKQYDLELKVSPAKPSLLSFSGPVRVTGPFSNPHVEAERGPLLARLGASVGLGLINPIAALLPLMDTGGETGVNCGRLMRKGQSTIDRIATGNSTAEHAEAPRQPER